MTTPSPIQHSEEATITLSPVSTDIPAVVSPTRRPIATNVPTVAPEPEQNSPTPASSDEGSSNSLPTSPLAPPIASQTWINSPPLEWASLRGKVVMVEFWTFDCINCRHVIPYLRGMYDSYRDKGFTLIGVHSPEFQYEHELANVQEAAQKMGLQYPIAIDNDFSNWNRYHNLYWPAIYLVDKRGVIRYTHFGEGAYDETRGWIEKLIQE